MYIIGAILAFSVLVIFHEFGHFIFAKLNDVEVEEFSLGMGPKIFGKKIGETEYTVKALPIGGYVKMLGEDGESSVDKRAFINKTPLQKLSIVAAGPITNFILAILLFGLVASARGYLTPVVSKVEANKPAAIAGLKKGDKIINVNNKKVLTWEDFVTHVYMSNGSPIDITFERGEEIKKINLVPIKEPKAKSYIVGVYPTQVSNPKLGEIVKYGFIETHSLIKQTFQFFKILFKGKVSPNDFGGPVTIIKVSSQAAKSGIITLIAFTAYLSVQLGIFNIIPFPALDGGWIFLLLCEIITGKKFDDNKIGFINYIGFAILMILMVLVTIKDILYPIKF